MDSKSRFSRALRESDIVKQTAADSRKGFPNSREGIRKRLEQGTGYDDVLITEDFTKLKDYALESGFITKQEAQQIATLKADRVAALIAEGKGNQFAGREFRPDMSQQQALAKRQEIGAGYAAQAPVERQKDIELLGKMGYTPEDVAKFGTDRSGFIPAGVPIFGGNEVPIASKSFWQDPARNLGISAYQGGVGLGATAEGMVAPARALATRFTGGDPTQFYAPNENPLVEAGTIFGSNAAESAAGFPARYAGMRIGGGLGFKAGMAASGGNPLWGGVGAVAGGMLGQLGMGSAMETLNDAAMNLILGRENAARLQQRKQEMSAAYPLASRVGEELPDLAMFGPSFKVKGFSGKAAAKGFKQAGMKGLRQGVVDTTEFAGDLAERGGESALNMVLAYRQSEDEKKLGMPGKSAWDILAEGALGAVMQGDTKLGRAVYGGMNKLTDPGMIQQAINRTAPGATATPMSPSVDTGKPLLPGMRRFNLGGRIESGVDEDGSPIIKGARYAVYDPEARKAQVYTDNEFALEGARTRKAAQSLQGTSNIFKRQPVIQYDDKVAGSQRQILGITRDAGVLVRDYTSDGKSTISAVPLSEIRNAKINKRINEVIENQGVKPNSRPAPFMPESFTNFNPVAFPDAVTLTTDSEPIPARVVERIGGKTDASYIVALPDGSHIRAHESQINVDKFTGGEHIIRGAMKDTDFPRSLADLAPKRGGLKGLVRIGEGADAPEVELTPSQRKDYQAVATKYKADIDAIKREPDATRRGQMLDIVQGKIANEYLATNPIPAPSGTWKEGDVVDVELSQTKFAGKPQTAIITDVNDFGYAVRLVDHPNIGSFTVQDSHVMGEGVPSVRPAGRSRAMESLASGRISDADSKATSGEGVPAVSRGYSPRGVAPTDVADLSDKAKRVDYMELPDDVQSSIQKRFKKAVDDGEVTSGNTIEFVEPIKNGQVNGQIRVHSLDNMTFQIIATTFPEGGGAVSEQYASAYNVKYNADTDMWDVYSVEPTTADRLGDTEEAAYMAISHLKNVAPDDTDIHNWDRENVPKNVQRQILNTYLEAVNVKIPIKPEYKTAADFTTLLDQNEYDIKDGKYITPFSIDSFNPRHYYVDAWTNEPLDMSDPLQYARASDVGRDIYDALSSSNKHRQERLEDLIRNRRTDAVRTLHETITQNIPYENRTTPELQLFTMMASKYTVKTELDANQNISIKLTEISKNNEVIPVSYAQVDYDAFATALRSGQIPKKAFLASVESAQAKNIASRNVPVNGWKKYPQSDALKDAEELSRDAAGTVWCVAGSDMAQHYMSQADFYVYFEDTKPVVAYCGDRNNIVEPPRGTKYSNQAVTAYEQQLALQHMTDNNIAAEYQDDVEATKAAYRIVQGIGTTEDVKTVDKRKRPRGYGEKADDKSASQILEKLDKGLTSTVDWNNIRFANRYTRQGGGMTQLEVFSELPEFKTNYENLTVDSNQKGFTFDDVFEIKVKDDGDLNSLKEIYKKYIAGKDTKKEIDVSFFDKFQFDRYGSNFRSLIGEPYVQTEDVDNVFINDTKNAVKLSEFDNDLSWAIFSGNRAPILLVDSNDVQTIKLNRAANYGLLNKSANLTVEIVEPKDSQHNGYFVSQNYMSSNDHKVINLTASARPNVRLSVNTYNGVFNATNVPIQNFKVANGDVTLTDSIQSVTTIESFKSGYPTVNIVNTTENSASVYDVRLNSNDATLNYFANKNPKPLAITAFSGKLVNLFNAHIHNYPTKDIDVDVSLDVDALMLIGTRHKVTVGYGRTVRQIDIERSHGKVDITIPTPNTKLSISHSVPDPKLYTSQGELNLKLDGDNNTVILNQEGSFSKFTIDSPFPVTLTQFFKDGWNEDKKTVTTGFPTERGHKIFVDLDSIDETALKFLRKTVSTLVKDGKTNLSVSEFATIRAIRQAIVAQYSGVRRNEKEIIHTYNTNLHEYDVSKIKIVDPQSPGVGLSNAEVRALLTANIEVIPVGVIDPNNISTAELVPFNADGLMPLINKSVLNQQLAARAARLAGQSDVVTPPAFELEDTDVLNISGLRPPRETIRIPDTVDDEPLMLDWTGHPDVDDDGTAYQEVDDADLTPSKKPKKVKAGYKLQGSFRASVPTAQILRYREERNKLAVIHGGVDTEAFAKAMAKLDKEYRALFNNASSQIITLINKLATQQRPNVVGYQQKETTEARIGYAIKSIDRNFNNLPKPAEGAVDNRLGTYKMMFNALGEDYQVDAFRVSNRAQLKTTLQKQYKYDSDNASRVAEVVDRFARAWAFGKMERLHNFRPTEIVEVTGKLAENLLEKGAYANPSSDMLFQHFPGTTAKETKLVAQYMREFYEERFAAFGVLDDAYDFTKKFRGAIFRTNKSKDDAILNVIVGFASRDETTGIHEIAHALYRAMGYDFQKTIAEAMGVNSATLRSQAMNGRVPIWVEERWAAAFEGSLRSGIAPQAKDVVDATRQRQQDPTLSKLWMELGDFLTGARNATIRKKIASGETPKWGINEVATDWTAKFKPSDKLYAGNELELTNGQLVRLTATQTAVGEPVQVVDVDSGKVSTVSVDEIKQYAGRVPSGFNRATLDTLSTWLRSYYGNTERNIRTSLPDMVADYSGGEVELGQLRAEATKLQKVAFQEVMDEPRSPLLSSLSRMSSVQAGLKSLLANNRLEIGNKGTVKNAYDRYGKPSNSFRVLRDVYGFDGNTAAAYYAQTETPEFKKWSENLPLLEAVNSIQISPDIDMNKMSPEERVNYRRYETGNELANLASEIMRDGADDNDVDKFVDLADQYYRGEGKSLKEVRKAVEDIVNANEDENVQRLMSFEASLRQELQTSEDFATARKVSVTSDVYRNAAHTPRTGKGFVTVSFPAFESSNLIRSKGGVVLTSGVTSFDGNRQGGEYIKFKNPQVVNLDGQGIDETKLNRIIDNATKAKRDGVVLLNVRHSNTVNSALHNVAVPITKYATKSIVAVPGVDIGTYFSGGGTLEASVYESVFPKFAVEYNAEIASVYRANYGDHVQVKDVQEIDPTSLKDVQWFHASPVCKNFSDANPNAIETILDKKTGKAVVDAIDHSRPPIVTIENVAKYRESESFDAILDALRRNGYEFDFGVYKTSKYGGGTSRQRLIIRAVRGFALPPIIKTDASQRTWYESIKDIIDTLPISELAPNQLRKLEASKIDVRAMKTPVLFSQNSYHAVGITADKVFPSFTTSGGTYRILMPGGTVRAVTGIAFRRMMGIPDAYLLPESEPLARKILANGVPAELSQTIMAPLADAYARNRMTRLVNQEMRRQDTGEEAAYQEVDDRSDIPERIDGATNFLKIVNNALVDNNLPIITARTLNFYVGKRIVNPTKDGRFSIYTAKDVMSIVALKSTQQEAEIRAKARQIGEAPVEDIANQNEFESITDFTIATNEFLKMAGGEPDVTERLIRYWISEGMLPPATEQRGRAKIWTSNQLEIAAQLAFQSQMRKQQLADAKQLKVEQASLRAEQPQEKRLGRPPGTKAPVVLLPQEERTNLTYAEVVSNANQQLQELGLEPVAERTVRFYISKGNIQKPMMYGRVAVFDPSVVDEVVNMRRPRNMGEKMTKEELLDKLNVKLNELDYKPATLKALQYWMGSGIIKPTRVGKANYFDDSAIDAIVRLRKSQARDAGEEAAYQEIDDLFPSQRRTVETYDMPGAPSHVERIRPKQLPPRNAWFWGAIDLYNDITRLPLSGDLAFQNLQGGIIGLSNPLVGLKAFKAGLQGFAPNMQVEVDGKLYGSRKFGRETYHAAGDAMRRHPMYNLAKEANLPLAMFEIDARLQEAREIELNNLKMSNPNATMKDVKVTLMDIDELGTVDEWYSKNRITRHLPMQGQFERFNSLVHDTLLLTQFDNWVKVLLSKGYQPKTTMFNNAVKDAARVLAVSVGDIKYSTNPESDAAASRIAKIFFTAPRWLMSRALIDPFINQMVSNSSIFGRLREIMGEDNPAFNLYSGDKEVAKLGQSMWLRIAGVEAMLALMAWVFSNWYPDTEVNTDIQPGRIRIGDFQIDPMAGLIDHYKLAGRLAKAVFSVDPKDAARAEKEGIPQWMMAVKDVSKELSYKASPGITFLQAITGMNDLKAQSDNFFTAPWEAKSMNVVGEPLFERSASAKIFYDMIRPRLRELFGDAVADDITISNMMMDRIPMALPGFIESFSSAKEYDRDPWVYAMADTIPNFFGFKVDVMPTEARKDRAKDKNNFTAEDSPTLLRLLAEGRASEAFTGTMKSSSPQGNVQPW